MPEPRVKFSGLRQILLDLGFKEVPVTKPHIGFQHDGADLLTVLPPYRGNSLVAPHHLVYELFALGLAPAVIPLKDGDHELGRAVDDFRGGAVNGFHGRLAADGSGGLRGDRRLRGGRLSCFLPDTPKPDAIERRAKTKNKG